MNRFVLCVSRLVVAPVLLLALAAQPVGAERITWKPITDSLLRIDDRAPKQWSLYRTGKKPDPLLLQLGARALVLYIHSQTVYEIPSSQLERKGDDLVWLDAGKPGTLVASSDWTTRDIGSAWRIRLTLVAEGRAVDIQIPQILDLRRGVY